MMRPHLMICASMLVSLMTPGLSAPPTAQAAEGASSNYIPGTYGDILTAVQPKPGSFAMVNYLGVVSSTIDKAVLLDNRAHTDVEVLQVFDAPLGLYTFEKPVLGGATFSVGGWLAIAGASLQSTLVTPLGSAESSTTFAGFAGAGLIPAYLSWKLGSNFSLAAFECIYIPAGPYSLSNPLNLNRGYWSFDQNVAVTWFNEKSGTDLSATGGLMVNTTNPNTDYHTGTEFHLEYVFNQFVTNFLSIGLHGYYYQQIADDRPGPKTTAALNLLNLNVGDLRSKSYGLGPQVNWVVNDNLMFAFSWIHDLADHYRMPSNYFYLNTYITF